jgi:hypothetical protein
MLDCDMTTETKYRERAKEARDRAAVAADETSRQRWLEIARGYEQSVEGAGQDPVARREGGTEEVAAVLSLSDHRDTAGLARLRSR